MNLYIDDIRNPKKDIYKVLRSSEEAIEYMIRNGCPDFISFDHDLGGEDTSMNVVKFMVDLDIDSDGEWIPENFSWNIHSANPVGAKNLEGYLSSYMKHKKNL